MLSVRRGAKGELLELLPKGTQGEGVRHESLMYLEIDRCANAAELTVLTREIEQVLAEVRVAVADFEPMKAKLREVVAQVEQTAFGPAQNEKGEVKAFLEWLLDNHFTFLAMKNSPSRATPTAARWSTTSSRSSACRAACAWA